jgi:hypothetical protein
MSKEANTDTSRKVATVNQIFGMVRTGSTKTASDFGKVCEKIEIEWKKILGDGAAPVDVFLLRSMDAAVQNGFLLSEVRFSSFLSAKHYTSLVICFNLTNE